MRDIKAYNASYYQRNKEKLKARSADYKKANPEKAAEAVRRWHKDPETYEHRRAYWRKTMNGASCVASRIRYASKPSSKAARSEYGKRWRTANKGKNSAKANNYRSSKICRTPKWESDLDRWLISEIYELAALRTSVTGVAHVVDHIVPLKGRRVSGLHTPTNLQVIPAVDNALKGNRFPIA